MTPQPGDATAMTATSDAGTGSGRCLQAGPVADSVIAAIRELNAGVEVVDRGIVPARAGARAAAG